MNVHLNNSIPEQTLNPGSLTGSEFPTLKDKLADISTTFKEMLLLPKNIDEAKGVASSIIEQLNNLQTQYKGSEREITNFKITLWVQITLKPSSAPLNSGNLANRSSPLPNTDPNSINKVISNIFKASFHESRAKEFQSPPSPLPINDILKKAANLQIPLNPLETSYKLEEELRKIFQPNISSWTINELKNPPQNLHTFSNLAKVMKQLTQDSKAEILNNTNYDLFSISRDSKKDTFVLNEDDNHYIFTLITSETIGDNSFSSKPADNIERGTLTITKTLKIPKNVVSQDWGTGGITDFDKLGVKATGSKVFRPDNTQLNFYTNHF